MLGGPRYDLELKDFDGMNILTSPRLLEERSLFVGFSGRLGGASSSPYDSLNVSLLVGDDRISVMSSRRRLISALGLSPEQLVACRQVHGNDVLVLPRDQAGSGARDIPDDLPEVDGIATDLAGVPVMLQFADCVPVAVFDVRKKLALALHCGRSGIETRLISAGLGILRQSWGSRPEDLVALVGPSIGPCCYNVGAPVANRFGQGAGVENVLPGSSLDLWSAVERQLKLGGISADNMVNPRICTSCHRDHYFSHRADNGCTGRQAMIVAIQP